MLPFVLLSLAPPAPTFEMNVRPIFAARCAGCHGAGHTRAGFSVLTRGDVIEGGSSGQAVIPGKPGKSLLVRLISTGKMPPGGKLPAAEQKVIESWIRGGAKGVGPASGHWAFRPPVAPPIPRIAGTQPANPVDAFLLAALSKRGLGFSAEADRRTLIRRVTFDLLGVPPTPAEFAAFLADRRPGAWARLVDRLLADPRYGERWARHWLDLSGYSDSEGVLQEDLVRPNAWRYRDYVIRAFNSDKPYDQFLREQIAGDELSGCRKAGKWTPEIEEQVTATGFLRTAVDATRDDFNMHQFAEYQQRMLNDTQTIFYSGVMGLTLQCTRCHDHKYEPFSQRDYYRVQAIFAPAVRPLGPLLPSRRRQIVAATAAEQRAAKETNARVDAGLAVAAKRESELLREFRLRALESALASIPAAEREPLRAAAALPDEKRSPEQKALTARHKALLETPADKLAKSYPEFRNRQAALAQERKALESQRVTLREIRAFYDQDAHPPATHILLRGQLDRPGEVVEPGVPALLERACRFVVDPPAKEAETTGRRTALANWIASPRNPLTARVLVNRVWAHHFGAGIVETLDNFGRSGSRPTNQPLLDWLAAAFRAPAQPKIENRKSKIGNGPIPQNWGVGGPAQHGVEGQPGIGYAPGFGVRPSANEIENRKSKIENGLGWSIKSLHRLILTSRAYRQASLNRPVAARVDSANRLLWRQRPRRLEAEAIRDSMLAVSGSLDPAMYGEPVPEEVRATGEVAPAGEEKGGRRSIYLRVRRSMPVTFLNAFDSPVMETNCTRRAVSTTAVQSLALLNSAFLAAQGRLFAARIVKERPAPGASGLSENARSIRVAWELAYNRHPSQAEIRAALEFTARQRALYDKSPATQPRAAEMALADLCQSLLASNEFAYVD